MTQPNLATMANQLSQPELELTWGLFNAALSKDFETYDTLLASLDTEGQKKLEALFNGITDFINERRVRAGAS